MAVKQLDPADYKLVLVKDLGSIKINGSRGKKRSATFKCTVCNVEVDLPVVEARKASCANCLVVAKEKEAIAYANDHIHVVSGVYYTQNFKHKKPRTFLVSMNELRNAHYHMQNNIKRWFTDYFTGIFLANPVVPIVGPYEIAYVYYYKNSASDLGNVCSLTDKYFCDAIQEVGVVVEDNVSYCKKITFLVGSQDKDKPRIEIFLRPFKQQKETND